MGPKQIPGKIAAINGVLAALALVMLYLASISPVGQLGLIAAAGLVPAAAVVSTGVKAGVLCYLTAGLLALILLPSKGAALLFLLLFGVYPLVKYAIERLHRLWLEWLLKLTFFNAVLVIFFFGLSTLLLSFLPMEDNPFFVICITGNVVFIVYDIGFSKVIHFYVTQIDRQLRRG